MCGHAVQQRSHTRSPQAPSSLLGHLHISLWASSRPVLLACFTTSLRRVFCLASRSRQGQALALLATTSSPHSSPPCQSHLPFWAGGLGSHPCEATQATRFSPVPTSSPVHTPQLAQGPPRPQCPSQSHQLDASVSSRPQHSEPTPTPGGNALVVTGSFLLVLPVIHGP